MGRQSNNKEIHVRGYSRQIEPKRFVAVALRPYLVAQGVSHREACHRLGQLIDAYVEDAKRDGRLEEALDRSAPFSYRLAYAKAWLIHNINHSVQPIEKTCCISQHA